MRLILLYKLTIMNEMNKILSLSFALGTRFVFLLGFVILSGLSIHLVIGFIMKLLHI